MWKSIAITAAIGALYLGFVFGHRWMENRRLEQHATQPAAVPQQYRTDELKILQFYSPRSRVVCYGVLNATKVTITPEPGDVSPALSRCVNVHIAATKEFTITAASRTGAVASQKVVVSGP